jgi:nitroreductase
VWGCQLDNGRSHGPLDRRPPGPTGLRSGAAPCADKNATRARRECPSGALRSLMQPEGAPCETSVARVIQSRRSIRFGFTGGQIQPDVLEEVVACGLAAPSSKNAQPFRLHVITDRALLAIVADSMTSAEDPARFVPKDPVSGQPREEYESTVSESADVLREASAAIVIENLGKFSISRDALIRSDRGDFADILLGYSLEVIGIGAAVENMWIAAHARDVEGTFMGDPLIAEDEIKRLLGIGNDLAGVLALGTVDGARTETREIDTRQSDRVRWYG